MKKNKNYFKYNKLEDLACIIGHLGLIPFIFSVLGIWFFSERYHATLQFSFLFYLSLIITFLSSVYWGIAIISRNRKINSTIIILSIIPIIFLYLINLINLEPYILLSLYLILLNLIYVIEKCYKKLTGLPDWYIILRGRLNFFLSILIIIFIYKLNF